MLTHACFSACLCDTYAESNECSKEISYASLLWRKEQIHFLPLIVPGSQGKTAFDMAQFVSEKTDKNGIDWIGKKSLLFFLLPRVSNQRFLPKTLQVPILSLSDELVT